MKIKLSLLIICLLFLTGCFNYKEINDLAIVSAMGIDKMENKYKVIVQVVNIQSSKSISSIGSANFVVYEGDGKSIEEAYNKILDISGKSLYINHLDILVLGEETVKNGIDDLMDFLGRNNNVRKQVPIVIGKSSSKEILSTITDLITLNSNSMKNSLLNNEEKIGRIFNVTIEDVLKIYLDEKKDLSLPVFIVENYVVDNENLKKTDGKNKVALGNMAIFKDNKLLKYLSDDESFILSLASGNVKNTLISYKCDESNYITFLLSDVKTKLKQKHKLEFEFNIKSDATIIEVNCKIDVESNEGFKKVNKELNSYIKNLSKENFKSIINYSSDPFGLRNLIYKQDYKYYKKIKNIFYENINKVEINIHSDINILSRGNTLRKAYNHE